MLSFTFNQIFSPFSKVGMEIERNKDILESNDYHILDRFGLIWSKKPNIVVETTMIEEVRTEPISLSKIGEVFKAGAIIESLHFDWMKNNLQHNPGTYNVFGESNHLNVGVRGIRKYTHNPKVKNALYVALGYLVYPFGVRLLFPRDSELISFFIHDGLEKTTMILIKHNFLEFRFNENVNLYQAYLYPLIIRAILELFDEETLEYYADQVFDVAGDMKLADFPKAFCSMLEATDVYTVENTSKLLEVLAVSLKRFVKNKRNIPATDKYMFEEFAKVVVDNLNDLFSLHLDSESLMLLEQDFDEYKNFRKSLYRIVSDDDTEYLNKELLNLQYKLMDKHPFVKARKKISKRIAQLVLEVYGTEIKQKSESTYKQMSAIANLRLES